jgi:hypothetical protein
MAIKKVDFQKFMDKIKQSEKGHSLDLSLGEDLSIAVMNLISLEEHMLFNGNKTGKIKYFKMLNEIREMRKTLLKEIVKDPEGEVWCTSKHLLAASMRLFEVGTKYQTKGEATKAYDMFKKSFDLYNLFWGINLGMVSDVGAAFTDAHEDKPLSLKKSDIFGKISGVVSKILDCCRE